MKREKMKTRLIKGLGAMVVGSLLLVGNVWATPYPQLDFGNGFLWDGTDLYTDGVVYTTMAFYGPNLYDSSPPLLDDIIWQDLTLDISFDNIQNDTIEVADFFSADVVIISNNFDPINMDPNPYVAYLDNFTVSYNYYFNGYDSPWLDQFVTKIDPNAPYDGQLLLSFTGLGGTYTDPSGKAWTAINGSGKIAPVPEPASMLLFGSGLIGLATIGRRKFSKKA